jgi:PAS domain S-box-containing protein
LAEARRLERSLRESEERYALVSQAVAEGIYDWNIELNSLFVSSRLMEIFSFEGPGLSSQDWYHRVHPEDKESYRTALRDCFKQQALKLECQYRIRAADGNYRWVEDHGLPVRNKVGRGIRLVGAVSDISRRHQTEQALRDRDHELDAVLDTIDYGILFMGPDLRAKIINRAFRQMWGISDEFIQTKRPTMGDLINYNRHNNLYDVPAVEFDDYVARRVEAVRSGTRSISEMRLLDGRIIQHRVMALPDGGRMLTYFDITDLKRSEEQLRRRTADLTESFGAADRHVGGAAGY